ncbi:MAG: B-box zinc finger protein [Syntrophotaleaceae bacterium]
MKFSGSDQRGMACPGCGRTLPGTLYNRARPVPCPHCRAVLEISVFPAFYRDDKPVSAQNVLAEGEANCFNHPQKKAVSVCEDCGRFLCALCEVVIGSRHTCPDCIETGRIQGSKQDLVIRRTMHDSIALSLALLPALIWPVTLLTAPAALFYAIRHWKSPTSILPRTKIRYLSAILFALLQVGGWTLLAVSFMTS